MEYADDPITSVIILENFQNVPVGYRALSISIDEGKNANLWPESLFDKGRRFMCYSKSASAGQDGTVVADIAITREGEAPPPGFTLIEQTHDTRQKALKRNNLYAKLVKRENASSALLELILISKEKKPRAGYTFAGEVNGFQVSCKAGPFRSQPTQRAQSFVTPSQYFTALPPGPATAAGSHMSVPASLAYGPPNGGYVAAPNSYGYGYAPNAIQRQDTYGNSASHTPISDVPFILNERFANALRSKRSALATSGDESVFTNVKTAADLDREYSYPFTLERSVLTDISVE